MLTHKKLLAGTAALALATVLSIPQASAQGRSVEQRTKFGPGAQHPLKKSLDKDDPNSKANNDEFKNTPAKPEKDKEEHPGRGTDKENTGEEEFDNDTRQKKGGGKSGADNAKKDKDDKGGGKGEAAEEKGGAPDPKLGNVLFASIDNVAIGSPSFQGAAENEMSPALVEAIFNVSRPLSEESRKVDALFATVHGADNRVRITPTTSYPWRAMVKLKMRFPNGKNYIGSGAMIGHRYVLTAGHCIYSAADGGWATSVECIPGFDNGYKPYGSAWATYFRSYTGWTSYGSSNHDWALVSLDRNIGYTVGWFGYGYWSSLVGVASGLGGYPGDRDYGLNLYYHWNYIASETANRTYYDIDTFGGQSGSGVFRNISGGYYVHTIHTNGGSTFNSGTRIDYAKFGSLQSWMSTGY